MKTSAELPGVARKQNPNGAGTAHTLKRMRQEIPLTDTEREAVDDGERLMANLAAGLKRIPTPDGRTPQQIEAEGEGDP